MITKTAYQPSVMSLISHDIRIPLTGIIGTLYFLNNTPLNHEQKEYVKLLQASAERLLKLENKLQNFLENNQT